MAGTATRTLGADSFPEYEGPAICEVSNYRCGFGSPLELARIYMMLKVHRDPVMDFKMLTGNQNVVILANGLEYRAEIFPWGYRQIASSPGVEEGRVLPFRRVG